MEKLKREEDYKKWLKNRDSSADFMDNSRDHIIDIAMNDLFTGNRLQLYDKVIITDYEAVNWMYKNMNDLKYFTENRPFAIEILEDVMEDVKKKTAPSVEGPSVEDMTNMISILKKSVQKRTQTNMNEVDGGSYRRRTKHLKKHAKKHSNKHFKKSRKCRKYRRN